MPQRLARTGHEVRRDARLAPGRIALTPRSYNADDHTVELVAATGYPVRRYDWEAGTYYFEQLAITPDAVNGERVDSGVAPLLDAHSSWAIADQLGRIVSWRVEGGELITVVKFGVSERALAAESEVAAGTWRGVSVGYRRDEMLKEVAQSNKLPTYTVTRWTLLEVSLVPIPADPASGVRTEDGFHPCSIIENRMGEVADDPANPEEEETMRNRLMGGVARAAFAPNTDHGADPAPAPETRAAPAAPASPPPAPAAATDANSLRMDAGQALEFVEDARAFGDEIATQARAWATTLTPDAARAQLVRAAADRQRQAAPPAPTPGRIEVTRDERDTRREAISVALLHRHNPATELTDAAREWRGMSLMEMARYSLEANGEKVRGLAKRDLAEMALRQHSTSDFPSILSNVAGKTLRAGYEVSPQTFKAWQRRATAPDFKQITRLQLGGAPSFLLVPEGGQFKQGTIGEGKEVYSLATYGRIFSVTRQTLINDDLDAFTRIPEMWGRAAADFESDVAYAPLIANPNMGDGVALFHATHGNLAGSGGAIAEATLQAGEIAMGNQKGIEGRPIRATPKFLLTAVKDKVAAQKLLTAVLAAQTSNVNVYAGSMTPIVEPRLNRASGATPWFMAADPAQVDTIEYAYLEGDDGVFLEERAGFEVDGMEFKARLDFASKAIDHRGLYMDPGV
jgi:hypothetical protein